jgi:hypothetical protein
VPAAIDADPTGGVTVTGTSFKPTPPANARFACRRQ